MQAIAKQKVRRRRAAIQRQVRNNRMAKPHASKMNSPRFRQTFPAIRFDFPRQARYTVRTRTRSSVG